MRKEIFFCWPTNFVFRHSRTLLFQRPFATRNAVGFHQASEIMLRAELLHDIAMVYLVIFVAAAVAPVFVGLPNIAVVGCVKYYQPQIFLAKTEE